MDQHQFDAALRALQAGTTRRAGLAGALGVLLGGRAGALAGDAARAQADASRAQAAPESGGWQYQSQFGRGCGSTTRYCLGTPFGMSISADGTTAYVVDAGFVAAARVAVYVRNPGSTTWYYSHAFGNICGSNPRNSHFCLGPVAQGLSVSADGTRAYVADTSKSRIAAYSRNPGSTTWYYSHEIRGLVQVANIALSGDELTALAVDRYRDRYRIMMYTRQSIGSTAWVFRGNIDNEGKHDYAALSPDGLTVWTTQRNRNQVVVLTRPSSVSTTWTLNAQFGTSGKGASNFDEPMGIAVSADTLTVWVADSVNKRIAVWARPDKDSTAWRPSAQFSAFGTGASKLKYPYNVAVSPDGLTTLVSGNGRIDTAASVVETWTKS